MNCPEYNLFIGSSAPRRTVFDRNEASRLIYLDNAATTCPSPAAIAAARQAESIYYNPSSLHKGGLEAERLLTLARAQTAEAFDGLPEEITFTSGGTEGDNTVFYTAYSSRVKHIIVSAMEHDAILEPAKRLESLGVRVDYAQPNPKGIVTPEEIERLLTPETGLVSLMLVNNETGSVQPLSQIAALLKRKKSNALLHTDAVQGFLKQPVPVARLGVDLATVSAHKIHGIKGAGAIWHKKGVRIKPLILGGGQEKGLRSGTEAVPALMAFGAACEEGKKELSRRLAHVEGLHRTGVELLSEVEGIRILSFENQSPYMLTLSAPGYKSEVLLHALAEKGICVSSGSACAKGKLSHVLLACGLDRNLAQGYLRISLSHENTVEELKALSEALKELLPTLLKVR